MVASAVAALLILLVLNAWMTLRLIRDDDVSSRQRWLQILLVWLLPFVGAFALLAIRKAQTASIPRSVGSESSVVDQSIDLFQSANPDSPSGLSQDP